MPPASSSRFPLSANSLNSLIMAASSRRDRAGAQSVSRGGDGISGAAPASGRRQLHAEGEILGEGPPVVLLHGLSATRRNVVQGSRALVKRGYRLISYDARGHGASQPAPSYEYGPGGRPEAVLEDLELERVALVGSSMGAATAMAFTLEHPERVPALVQITPAYTGYARTGDVDGESWEKLAAALDDGIERFLEVAQPGNLPERWREVAREATRQRMERHGDLAAVAQALREVPSSIAWKGLETLSELEVPVLVVGSQDDSDWLHPLGVAEEYCRKLPNCELRGGGQGRLAAGVAGSAPVERDRRLLRARRLHRRTTALKAQRLGVGVFLGENPRAPPLESPRDRRVPRAGPARGAGRRAAGGARAAAPPRPARPPARPGEPGGAEHAADRRALGRRPGAERRQHPPGRRVAVAQDARQGRDRDPRRRLRRDRGAEPARRARLRAARRRGQLRPRAGGTSTRPPRRSARRSRAMAGRVARGPGRRARGRPGRRAAGGVARDGARAAAGGGAGARPACRRAGRHPGARTASTRCASARTDS